MTDILSPGLALIIDSIYDKINKKNIDFNALIFKSVGCFFLIIACILFNEVIICNFWKLDYYTNKEINERGIEEVIQDSSDIVSNNDSISDI